MTATDPQSAAILRESLTGDIANLDITGQKSDNGSSNGTANASNLSQRGIKNASFLDEKVEKLLQLFRNLYDPDTNPDGIVNLGVADNALCRSELLEYFNHQRLHLHPGEMTYADRFTASTRLFNAVASLFNDYTPDYPEGNACPLPHEPVTADHIAVGSGATGVLDQLFWTICNPGDGVLVAAPYYNAFDNDLTSRAEAVIVPVSIPPPGPHQTSISAEKMAKLYQDALVAAEKRGIKVKVLLFCNPHNPTGEIYSRDHVVALAQVAAKNRLHFVSDEIYARSCFPTHATPKPTPFHSILSIDTKAEVGLDPSYVHVVTSASKDFGINGFRLGVLVSQHNKDLHRAMSSLGLLAQSSSPAAALWYTFLEDKQFLTWYLRENRRRMSLAYAYVTEWLDHYRIPYAEASSGHFFLVDFSRFLGGGDGVEEEGRGDEQEQEEGKKREKEGNLVSRMIDARVFVAPGSQYHHPVPGWFRFTYTQDPKALRVGLTRLAGVFGFSDGFEEGRPMLDLHKGGQRPPSSTTTTAQRSSEENGVSLATSAPSAATRSATRKGTRRVHYDLNAAMQQGRYDASYDDKKIDEDLHCHRLVFDVQRCRFSVDESGIDEDDFLGKLGRGRLSGRRGAGGVVVIQTTLLLYLLYASYTLAVSVVGEVSSYRMLRL